MSESIERAEELLGQVLELVGLGSDPELKETPRRVVELLRSFVAGEEAPPSVLEVEASGPVVVRGLPFHSLCVHHLLPFFGTATIAYRPSGRVIGFGGVARQLASVAGRPQLQERMGEQLAEILQAHLAPSGLLVVLCARQMCMEMRGVRSAGETVTFAERGDVSELRALI